TDDSISVEGKSFKVFKIKDPAQLDWASVGASIVVESTGLFTAGADARKHIRGPVKKVIISAPATDPDATFVLGVNDKTYDPAKHHVVSNASCTTNCLAPVAKALKLVIPELDGKLDGYSMRVPTPNVSVVDLTVFVEKPATKDSVNAALK